jgi:hypothetical protein
MSWEELTHNRLDEAIAARRTRINSGIVALTSFLSRRISFWMVRMRVKSAFASE